MSSIPSHTDDWCALQLRSSGSLEGIGQSSNSQDVGLSNFSSCTMDNELWSIPGLGENWSSYPRASIPSDLEIGQFSATQDPGLSFSSSCRADKISSLFTNFNSQKAELIQSIGFGGLLKIPPLGKLSADLSIYLFERLDTNRMCLCLDGGVEIFIRNPDVDLVLGIPFHGQSVSTTDNNSKDTIRALQKKLCSDSSVACLTMPYLEDILSKEYGSVLSASETDAFKIASVLFSVCYLLAPRTEHEFPLHLIENFIHGVNPGDINWAEFLLSTLAHAALHCKTELYRGSRNILIFGCTLFLQVFYLDNLNFGPCTPYHIILPRASEYTVDLMTDLIVADFTGTSNDKRMLFGGKKVRMAFDVCYTRGWSHHTRMCTSSINADTFLMSIDMLREATQMLDKFAGELKYSDGTHQPSAGWSFDAKRTSYLQLRQKIRQNMHGLCTRAADVVKKRNLTIYHQHIPKDMNHSLGKRTHIGTSKDPALKKINSSVSGTLLGKTVDAGITPQTTSSNLASGSGSIISSIITISRQVAQQQSSGPGSSKKLGKIDIKSIKPNVDLKYKHPAVSYYDKSRTYLWITDEQLSTEVLNRHWVVFDTPMPLAMTGLELQQCLKISGNFSFQLMDAIMVVWNHLDDEVCKNFKTYGKTLNRWRHFLAASFAHTLMYDDNFLNSETVRSNLIGKHIHYNVEDCEKIAIPTFGELTWSCYLWDFKACSISILDPFVMSTTRARARAKHQQCVWKIHDSLVACINKFFPGWAIKAGPWNHIYEIRLSPKCKVENSGLYAAHFARSYNGDKLEFDMKHAKEANLTEARGEIMYRLFTCPANKGYKPDDLLHTCG